MSHENVLNRVHKLLTLAVKSSESEEARSAAVIAARLIVANNLLQPKVEEATLRDHEELRPIIDRLFNAFLDTLWQERKTGKAVTVPRFIETAITNGDLRPMERDRAKGMLSHLVNQERLRGVVIGMRGRHGGYRLAPGVRKARAHA